MYTRLPLRWLPSSPYFSKFSNKIALGLILAIFLLGLQPQLGYPPLTQGKVMAQEQTATTTQTQIVNGDTLPVQFQLPHPGYMSTPFSSYHPGIDIAAGLGMPIKPIAKGVVSQAGYTFWGLGLMVEIDHGYGYKSVYGHMGKIYTSVGKQVQERDIIGEVGLTGHTTGPHTHLEISLNGTFINPAPLLPDLRNYPTAADLTPITGGETSLIGKTPTFTPPPAYVPQPTSQPKVEEKTVENTVEKVATPALNLNITPKVIAPCISLSLTKSCN